MILIDANKRVSGRGTNVFRSFFIDKKQLMFSHFVFTSCAFSIYYIGFDLYIQYRWCAHGLGKVDFRKVQKVE